MTTGNDAKRLFLEAIDLDPRERQPYLADLRRQDERLHARVEQLVAAHLRAEVAAEEATVGGPEPNGLELPFRLGNYDLIEEIALGGSGIVYRARQVDLDRTVAIKLLRTGQLATQAEVRRFRAEAEMAARLDHPSIVPVYEVGSREGRHFISMKLVSGASLDRCAADFKGERAAAALVAQVARAVHHGHRHGVLHRDVKPSNVLIDEDGQPFVADFGTAKLLDGEAANTFTGVIVGTPSYMAPEQATAGGNVTISTDVYSLGCMLYELLAGRPPFVADDLVEILRQVREEVPPLLRSVRPEAHADLETICDVCLAKDPLRRYESALEMAEDLERWLAFEPIRARPAGRLERIWLAWRRKPVVASLGAAVALLLVVLVIGSIVAGFQLRTGLENTRAAEETAREQLRSAYVAEARALRVGGRVGRRVRGLELLRLAAEIRPGSDLVNEAVASLAHSDLTTVISRPREAESESWIGFDPGLERYAVGLLDGVVEVRRTTDGLVEHTLEGNSFPAWSPTFSHDSRYLALAHHPPTGRPSGMRSVVWDLEQQAIVHSIDGRPSANAAFAPGEPILVLGLPDGRLLERHLVTGAERFIALDDDVRPAFVRYSPDGERLAVISSQAGPIRVLSRAGGLVSELGETQQWFTSLAWSPDSRRVVSIDHDRKALVWEADSGVIQNAFVFGGGPAYVRFLSNDMIAVYSWDHLTRLWDLDSGELILASEDRLIEASTDGLRLAFVTHESVKVQRLLHRDVLRTLHAHTASGVRDLDVSPDGRFVASGGIAEFVVWDLQSGTRLDGRAVEEPTELLFDAAGDLYVASRTGLDHWEVEDGRLRGRPVSISSEDCRGLARDSERNVVAAKIGGDMHLMFHGAPGNYTRIPLPPNSGGLAVGPEGQWVAAGSWRGSGVNVWRVDGRAHVAHLEPKERACYPHFSPDGQLLALGGRDQYTLFRVGTWDVVRQIPRRGRYNGPAWATRFSPDGSLLAAMVGQRQMGLLDSSTGHERMVLEAPGAPMPYVTRFTPDGSTLLVGTFVGTILVWDLVGIEQKLRAAGLDHDQ